MCHRKKKKCSLVLRTSKTEMRFLHAVRELEAAYKALLAKSDIQARAYAQDAQEAVEGVVDIAYRLVGAIYECSELEGVAS